jgi:hypothetical protein
METVLALAVDTIAQMADIHVAPLPNDTTCYVRGDGGTFRLLKTSARVADGNDIVAPATGSPIAGLADARWERIGPQITQSQAVAVSGAIATSTIMQLGIPENITAQYEITLEVRRDADGASASYKRVVTISRDGAVAPIFNGAAADLVAQESADGTIAADWSFPTLTFTGNLLNIQFAIAVNVYTALTAKASVARQIGVYS